MRGQDRHGDGARGGDAGERVVLGGAVEEDEREADAERGDERELERQLGVRRRLPPGSLEASIDAGQRRDDPDPLQRAGALAVEARPQSTGTIALVATIGATMLIVPTASAR